MALSGAVFDDGAPASAVDLVYALRGLGLAAAILHIGVHPDDEDVGMVALAARGLGARTVYWSATRGEGSANRLNGARAEALGVLRTWESLSARALDGGEVLYGPFYDFGFSKTPADTFARWPRAEVTREVARAIRLVQPLVIVSRWSGNARDGHGQHQAIGVVVRDACELAADPEALPELGLPAWEARKLYRSLGGDWQPGEDAQHGARVPEYEQAGHLRIDTGAVDPVSGRSFQELGHLALNQHRTQGMAFAPERGSYSYYYRLEFTHGFPVEREASFFDGLQTRLSGLADYPSAPADVERCLTCADAAIDAASEAFDARRPAAAGQALLLAHDALGRGRASLATDSALHRYLSRKLDDMSALAARCLGLRLECRLDRHRVTPLGRVGVTSRVWSDGTVDAQVGAPELELPDRWTAEELGAPGGGDAVAAVSHQITVGDRRWTASPYWLREPRGPGRYVWPRSGALSQPLDRPLVHTHADVRIGEHELRLTAAAYYRRAVPGGTSALPLAVLPPVTLEPQHTRMLLPVPRAPVTFAAPVLVRCMQDGGEAATVAIACPAGWSVQPAAVHVEFDRRGDEQTVSFQLTLPTGAAPGLYDVRYLVATGGAPYGVSLEPVRLGLGTASPSESSAVAETFVSRPSTLTVTLIDVAFIAGHRYAYVPGLEDEIFASLGAFDLDLTEVSGEELAFADLDGYDAIVVGPNAYNARPAVRTNASRLLDYVAGGGTLIVLYQAYGFDAPALAPFPFGYSQPHDRVTLAGAPVTHATPDHPVLTTPNAIGPSDWHGWVHDRGLYFFGTWDPRYTAVLAAADPGEEPCRGGLMVAAHGRGTFAYTGLSLHRQIPAGVAGGVRLFANLLGLARARERELAGGNG